MQIGMFEVIEMGSSNGCLVKAIGTQDDRKSESEVPDFKCVQFKMLVRLTQTAARDVSANRISPTS
jgi:hypothetical protein